MSQIVAVKKPSLIVGYFLRYYSVSGRLILAWLERMSAVPAAGNTSDLKMVAYCVTLGENEK